MLCGLAGWLELPISIYFVFDGHELFKSGALQMTSRETSFQHSFRELSHPASLRLPGVPTVISVTRLCNLNICKDKIYGLFHYPVRINEQMINGLNDWAPLQSPPLHTLSLRELSEEFVVHLKNALTSGSERLSHALGKHNRYKVTSHDSWCMLGYLSEMPFRNERQERTSHGVGVGAKTVKCITPCFTHRPTHTHQT